ncbi:unnamed protein product, partial [Rotaria magnacalcarata]
SGDLISSSSAVARPSTFEKVPIPSKGNY